jgi:hypothetical protein
VSSGNSLQGWNRKRLESGFGRRDWRGKVVAAPTRNEILGRGQSVARRKSAEKSKRRG